MIGNFSRQQYRHPSDLSRRESRNEYGPSMNQKLYTIHLRHRRRYRRRHRTDSKISLYDNIVSSENEGTTSKWNIVRQRLPDILALSETYKPKSVRAQLTLLVALMTKQTTQLRKLSLTDPNHNLLHIPTHVAINIGDRSRLIYLKRIPPEQVIHVDIDDLTFSIPTRQFIIAISRGDAHQTAAKFCPPAVSDMLIDLSKTKVAHDGKQYRRALVKMRIGQGLFFALFIFIISMILTLAVGATNTLLQLNKFNHTKSNISLPALSEHVKTGEYSLW